TLATFASLRAPACDYNGNDNTNYDADKCPLKPHEHDVVVGRQTEFTVVWQQEPESSRNKAGDGRTYRQPFCPRRERRRASEQHESCKREWEQNFECAGEELAIECHEV